MKNSTRGLAVDVAKTKMASKPPKLMANCRKNLHAQCFSLRCSCRCHEAYK